MSSVGYLRAGLVAAVGLGLLASSRASEGRNASPEIARAIESLPPYAPRQSVSGVIRLWGHGSFSRPFMRLLVARWTRDFKALQPNVEVVECTYGTSSAIPALALGAGNLAILGEEILPEATDTFERVKHYPPLGVMIATGSVDVRNFDYAQMFFVHRDNPLRTVSVAQLDAIFGAEHRRSGAVIRTWGELGLSGEWAAKAITPYGWRTDDSFGIYLEEALLGGSHQWNPALVEFSHHTRPDGSIYDHGQQILDALSRDRYGIAVSNVRYAGEAVRALAVAPDAHAAGVPVSAESLFWQRYPFARLIPAYVDCPPGGSIDPKVREFLSYLLSRQGQQAILSDGRYLPLNPLYAETQRRLLR